MTKQKNKERIDENPKKDTSKNEIPYAFVQVR
jgi:hypothetical protein